MIWIISISPWNLLPWSLPLTRSTNLAYFKDLMAPAAPCMLERSTSGPSVSLNPAVSMKYIFPSKFSSYISYGTSMDVMFLVTDLELGYPIRFLTPLISRRDLGVTQGSPSGVFFKTISWPSKDRIVVDFPAPVNPMNTIAFSLKILFPASLLFLIKKLNWSMFKKIYFLLI